MNSAFGLFLFQNLKLQRQNFVDTLICRRGACRRGLTTYGGIRTLRNNSQASLWSLIENKFVLRCSHKWNLLEKMLTKPFGICNNSFFRNPALQILCRGGYFLLPCKWIAIAQSPKVTSKEPALNTEKESRRTWPRCHVSLEKSSRNHKPLEEWAKPNLSPSVPPRPADSNGEYFPRVFHVVIPDPPELSAVLTRHSLWQNQGRGRGDLRFDIAH